MTGANGAIAMFKLEGGLLLNLYPRTDLAKDAAIPIGPPRSGEFSLRNSFVAARRLTGCWRRRRPRVPRSPSPRPTLGHLLRLLP